MIVAFKDTLKETSAVQLERMKMYSKTKKKAYPKRTKPNQIQKRMHQISFSNREMLICISPVKVIQTFFNFKNCFSQYEAWTDILFQIWF